ncbi:hypothetical protein Tco_0216717 [Tanacetum coccineum]
MKSITDDLENLEPTTRSQKYASSVQTFAWLSSTQILAYPRFWTDSIHGRQEEQTLFQHDQEKILITMPGQEWREERISILDLFVEFEKLSLNALVYIKANKRSKS